MKKCQRRQLPELAFLCSERSKREKGKQHYEIRRMVLFPGRELKMLVALVAVPVATPCKAVLRK